MNVRPFALLGIFAAFAVGATGCAEEVDADEEVEGTEDELRSLRTTEVVGSVRTDMEAMRAEAPTNSGYRAFDFTAAAGEELVAYVVATNGADPIAYILDADFKPLKRNDNRTTATKDAEIRFKAPKAGKYLLGFRTAANAPATVLARINSFSSGDARTGRYTDGWRVSPRSGEPSRTTFVVNTFGKGKALTSYSGCPQNPPFESSGLAVPSSLGVTVKIATREVSVSTGISGGSAKIADDGTFDLERLDGGYGTIRARGRVAAGGIVILDQGETVQCSRNYRSETVYNATRVTAAIGATDTN